MLLHTEALTRSTQKLCTHRKNRNFTSVFRDRPSFRAKALQREPGNHNFTWVFDDRTSFRAKALRRTSWNRNFTSVFGDRTSFRAKGLRRTSWNRNFTSVYMAIEPHFVRKGCAGQVEIAILPQFLTIEPPFVRKGCAGQVEIAILLHFLTIEPRFVRKGCVSCRLVGTAPAPAFRREIEKKERARGQEGKRRRCEDVRMWRCEDVRMRRREDEQMWRCEDVKMRRCEDEKMWRWEDVKMRRCEDEKMWRWGDVKIRRCEDEKMWRWEDVKMIRCEDEKMWSEKMWRWEDVKMRRCEVSRCEDEKMRYRPPLLEEPCAQTLSGKLKIQIKKETLVGRHTSCCDAKKTCLERFRNDFRTCHDAASPALRLPRRWHLPPPYLRPRLESSNQVRTMYGISSSHVYYIWYIKITILDIYNTWYIYIYYIYTIWDFWISHDISDSSGILCPGKSEYGEMYHRILIKVWDWQSITNSKRRPTTVYCMVTGCVPHAKPLKTGC